MLKEFRDFAMRGNVMDLAVGVITPHPVRAGSPPGRDGLRWVQVSAEPSVRSSVHWWMTS